MEGLLRALQQAQGVPVLNYFDELELMFKKASVPGSAGTTPLHVLYEENAYSHTLRQGNLSLVNAHLALLGNATTDRFSDIWEGEHIDSGFFSRWMLVTAPVETRRMPNPQLPDETRVSHLGSKIKEIFDRVRTQYIAQGSPVLIGFADEAAEKMWSDYYIDEIDPSDPSYNRIDTIGERLMMILALAQNQTVIDIATVRAVIEFLRYQVAVRRILAPQVAENPTARVQKKILARLGPDGALTRRELYRAVHADRYGTHIFDMALSGLQNLAIVKSDGDVYSLTTELPVETL